MLSSASECGRWAREEFRSAKLGDKRRENRLVQVASQLMEHPHGSIARAFPVSADREAAYRFVESDFFSADDVARAAHEACFRRAEGLPFVFVPTDATSISIESLAGTDALGRVGSGKSTARGLQVMSAIAVAPDGTPVGVCGQRYWIRPVKVATKAKARSLAEKESKYWLDVGEQVLAAREAVGSSVKLWFQLDRGGDFREQHLWGAAADADITIRAAQDRKVESPEDSYLWNAVLGTAPLGRKSLSVPGNPNRTPREATLELRATPVVLQLRDRWNKTQPTPIEVYAVHAKEVSAVPADEKPIEWMLLTTRKADTLDEANLVLFGYSQRWRIEEVHKAWKSICQVESTAISDERHLAIWASLLFAVAVRIERLKRLARTQPELPATVELTGVEIRALQLDRDLTGYKAGAIPSISKAVRWIADMGGYMNPHQGPPGTIVIGRGLLRLAERAANLQRIESLQK